MCEAQKNKELEVLDKKRQELTEIVVELGKKSEDTKSELQVIRLKENSHMWDRIEVFERYAEQERALRIQAVNLLRRHEEKMLGGIK
jgi:NCAIR mutase (PurE)-related protein